MRNFLFALLTSVFLICGTMTSCVDHGTHDPVIVQVDGSWIIGDTNEGTINFYKDDEWYEMFSERGDIYFGTYSAIPCATKDSIALDYETEDGEYFYNECKVRFTESPNIIFVTNLPFYETEEKKLIRKE